MRSTSLCRTRLGVAFLISLGAVGGLAAAPGPVVPAAQPARSLDAALLAMLTPDQYSVRVEGATGGGGMVLVEVYEAP